MPSFIEVHLEQIAYVQFFYHLKAFMKIIKTSIVIMVLCLFKTTNLNAQKLMHSLGATISVLYGKISSNGSSSSFTLQQTNFCYFPRYNIVENDNSSVSLGAPVGIGIGLVSNTYGSDNGIAFAYDLPVVIDYNIGCKSTSDNDKNFGYYFGLGFGYYKVNLSSSQYSDFKGASYGPMLRGGVRIGSLKESWAGHSITVGMFYKKGLEANKLSTVGFNVLYDL